jgi:hypothetical protein
MATQQHDQPNQRAQKDAKSGQNQDHTRAQEAAQRAQSADKRNNDALTQRGSPGQGHPRQVDSSRENRDKEGADASRSPGRDERSTGGSSQSRK